jgi:NDP-sugar pyrophosphorylase family protein
VIVGTDEQPQLQAFIESQFASGQRGYPHRVEFRVVKDIANTTLALKEVLAEEKQLYSGYIVQHADTINAVPLNDVLAFHQQRRSEATLVAKPKRELGDQEKKLPEGELETEIDNVLIGEKGECLFLDMAEEVENEGVRIEPSIFKQVRRGSFRRMVDSRTYIFGPRVSTPLAI